MDPLSDGPVEKETNTDTEAPKYEDKVVLCVPAQHADSSGELHASPKSQMGKQGCTLLEGDAPSNST
jgi:hypothetical protein